MRTMRTPAAPARARSSRPATTGSRLLVRAFSPHEPGCSTSSHRDTTDAVAKRGSSRASEASEQRNALLVNGNLEEPFSHESPDEHERALGIQISVEVAHAELCRVPDGFHRRGNERGHLELSVDKEDFHGVRAWEEETGRTAAPHQPRIRLDRAQEPELTKLAAQYGLRTRANASRYPLDEGVDIGLVEPRAQLLDVSLHGLAHAVQIAHLVHRQAFLERRLARRKPDDLVQ